MYTDMDYGVVRPGLRAVPAIIDPVGPPELHGKKSSGLYNCGIHMAGNEWVKRR